MVFYSLEVFMKRWFIFLLVFPLAACSLNRSTSPQNKFNNKSGESLPVLGDAPELTNDIWLNTDVPLRLEDLYGKVVLIDMWTFG